MRRIVKKIINFVLKSAYRILYKGIPCDDKTVLFIAFHGRGYMDNPKALHECLIHDDHFKDYIFVWALRNPQACEIKHAKKVKYLSLSYFYYLAHSKYWISNCKLPSYILKKQQQVYLQTWHGTPLKRLAHDIQVGDHATFYRSGLNAEEMRGTYDDDVSKYSYMISPNAFSTDVFQSAFQIEKARLIETGYPRNDCLVTPDEDAMRSVKKRLSLPEDKKIILYAPTWRDNSYVSQGYTFKLQVDFTKWKHVLGDEYIVLFKPHYLIINSFQAQDDVADFVYSVDASSDINDLYLISDILITDYSSVFFDYAILNRPIYFYMYDLKEYQEELRGFYLDIYTDLPNEPMTDEEELLEAIKHHEFNYDKLADFNRRFNHLQDGKSSQRVIDIVFSQGEGSV